VAVAWSRANAVTDGASFLCRECWDSCEVSLLTSGEAWPDVVEVGNCEICEKSINPKGGK
jgi:hypothetical protein